MTKKAIIQVIDLIRWSEEAHEFYYNVLPTVLDGNYMTILGEDCEDEAKSVYAMIEELPSERDTLRENDEAEYFRSRQ